MRIITSGRGFGLLPVHVFRAVFQQDQGKKIRCKKQRENSKQKTAAKDRRKIAAAADAVKKSRQ